MKERCEGCGKLSDVAITVSVKTASERRTCFKRCGRCAGRIVKDATRQAAGGK